MPRPQALERPTPRELRLHPQRETTAAVFVVGGLAFMAWVVIGTVRATAVWTLGKVAGLAFAVLFLTMFVYIGLAAWMRRIDLLIEAGEWLVLVDRPLRGAGRQRTVALARVSDVVVEVDDGAARIVIECGDERMRLTDTATTDDLQAKAAAIKHFLGVRPDEPVRVVDRGPT